MKINHVMLILVVLAALFVMAAAPLQVEPPTDGTPASTTNTSGAEAAFVAQVVAIAAFVQKRLKLEGYAMIGAALLVAGVLWFSPFLAETFPDNAKLIDSAVTFLKLSFTALGSVDFLIFAGTKIATAKLESSGKIAVGVTK